MESVPLEMDDLFGEEEDVDQAPDMLPDLPEAEDQAEHNEEETDHVCSLPHVYPSTVVVHLRVDKNKKVLDKLKGMKGASKNTVKRPMPKLDSTRLTGERGIPILPHIFKGVKLKGKGHEVTDLRVVMRFLEHWGHRLFPMLPFDQVLDRVERLGAKREVQTCIKKMRMDIPVLGSDTVSRGEEEEEEEGAGETTQQQQSQQTPSAEDLFDSLMQAEQELEAESGRGTGSGGDGDRGRQRSGGRDSPSVRRGRDGGDGGASQSPHRGQGSSLSHTAPVPSDAATDSTALSAEVLERIALKRRQAMEKRARKLGLPITTSPPHGILTPANEGGTQHSNQQDQPDLPSNQPDLPSNQPDAVAESVTDTQADPISQADMMEGSVTASATETQPSKATEVAEDESVSGDPTQEMESVRSDPTQEMESPRSDPRQEMESVRSDPTQEMESPRSDPRQEMESVRSDPTQEMESVRSDPTQEMESVRSDPTQEMESVRSDPTQEIAEETLP